MLSKSGRSSNIIEMTKFANLLPAELKQKQKELETLKKAKSGADAIEGCRRELFELNRRLADVWIRIGTITQGWHGCVGMTVAYNKYRRIDALGLSRSNVHRFEKMAENPAIVEMALREAANKDRRITINRVMAMIEEDKKFSQRRSHLSRRDSPPCESIDNMRDDEFWFMNNRLEIERQSLILELITGAEPVILDDETDVELEQIEEIKFD